jgi:hypothetical protein
MVPRRNAIHFASASAVHICRVVQTLVGREGSHLVMSTLDARRSMRGPRICRDENGFGCTARAPELSCRTTHHRHVGDTVGSAPSRGKQSYRWRRRRGEHVPRAVHHAQSQNRSRPKQRGQCALRHGDDLVGIRVCFVLGPKLDKLLNTYAALDTMRGPSARTFGSSPQTGDLYAAVGVLAFLAVHLHGML